MKSIKEIVGNRRLLLLANAEPWQLTAKGEQRVRGGLTSGLDPLMKRLPNVLWIGWGRGDQDFENKDGAYIKMVPDEEGYPLKRVPLSEKEREQFYLGFSNAFLWFLFHGFWQTANYDDDERKVYDSVNEKYGQMVLEEYQGSDDLVWIHDYHLMKAPQIIRDEENEAKIAFFLHIPWPAWDDFRHSPQDWRRDNLMGLLGSDLIGFHIDSYRRKFLECIREALRKEELPEGIVIEGSKEVSMPSGRSVELCSAPLGIDHEKFSGNEETRKLAQRKKEKAKKASSQVDHIIIGLDREDPTKGIEERLEGYKYFLERELKKQKQDEQNFYGRTILIQKTTKSRDELNPYTQLSKEVEGRVGNITSNHNRIFGWTPVEFSRQDLPRKELIALNHISEIGLVTPLVDGMNLVAKEYVAGAPEDGMLILSENAGVAEQFGSNALLVNPQYPGEIADALNQALRMPGRERRVRMKAMKEVTKEKGQRWWRNKFMRKWLSLYTS